MKVTGPVHCLKGLQESNANCRQTTILQPDLQKAKQVQLLCFFNTMIFVPIFVNFKFLGGSLLLFIYSEETDGF
jgi:hypothetical protein